MNAPAGYDRGYFEREYFELHPGKKRYLRFLADQIERLAPPSGAWLDVGSGLGFFVAECRARGRRAFGAEHAVSAALAAGQCARTALVVSDVERGLPFASGSFAAICLWDVIEHLRRPDQALAECRRALAPSGVLSVLTLNAHSVARPLLGRSWSYHLDPTHVRLYSARSLRRELSDAGFHDVRMATWMNFLSAGEGDPRLKPLRRLARVARWPCLGDSLIAFARAAQ